MEAAIAAEKEEAVEVVVEEEEGEEVVVEEEEEEEATCGEERRRRSLSAWRRRRAEGWRGALMNASGESRGATVAWHSGHAHEARRRGSGAVPRPGP